MITYEETVQVLINQIRRAEIAEARIVELEQQLKEIKAQSDE